MITENLLLRQQRIVLNRSVKRQRRIDRQYIGSAHVEQANDLIVAQRQMNCGMLWSETTSDALAALGTVMRNGGWERYWQRREVLPLLAA